MFQCILVDGYKWKGVGGVQEVEIEKRGSGEADSQGGGNWEKQGKIMQHCTIFAAEKAQRGRGQQN